MFRDAQGIVDFNAQVPDGALQLGMPEQKLYRPKVAGLSVDMCRLGTPQRVSAVLVWIKTDAGDPLIHNPGVLTRGKMREAVNPARE